MKKGAIFDMDGLMFDTEALWQEGWRILAREFSYEPSPDFARDISGTSGEVMIGVVNKYYDGIDAEEFIKKERAYVEDKLAREVPIKEGLFTILDYFREHKVKMAVASSSRRQMIEDNLDKAGCRDYFDVVLSSTEVEKAKPAPDVFLAAAKELGLDPADCYVFEDSFGGIRAGHAAGCLTVMVPDQQQPTEEIRSLADGVYVTLTEVTEAIRRGEI